MGVGEQMERARRRRFWTVLGLIGAAGVPVGFLVGFNSGRHDVGIADAAAMLPPWAILLTVTAYLLSMTVGCYVFARSIDEVEMADNLWASTAGYYAYMLLFPCWWLLAKGGMAHEPNDWLIFFVAGAVGIAVYGWRKWRAR